MGQSLRNRTSTVIPFPIRLTPDPTPPTRDSLAVETQIDDAPRGTETFAGGALVVDWRGSSVEHRGARVSLLRVELQLLGAVLEANGGIVSRAALIQAAWPRSDSKHRENSLAVYICGLRKRLAMIGLSNALQTVRREGYRMEV